MILAALCRRAYWFCMEWRFEWAYVGKNNIAKYDMFIDTSTGQIWLIGKQTGTQVPTLEFYRY